MTTILTLAMLWLIMVAVPDIPLSRSLRRASIETPARWCARVTRGHLLLVVGLVTMVALVGWLLEADGLNLLRMASPELVSWIVMFDVATYLDVAATALLVGGSVRLSAIAAIAVRIVRRPRARTRRSQPTMRQREGANDDGDGRPWAVAA